MMNFYETVRGARFFDGQVPQLIRSLERIADALEEQNRIQEKAIEIKQERNEAHEN